MNDLKMSRAEFSNDEDICEFVKNNIHGTQDIVKFYAGTWANYVPMYQAPKDSFKQVVDSLFKAYERREPFLEKILTPANRVKIIGDIDNDFSLTHSGFIGQKKNSAGAVLNAMDNFFMFDWEEYDFSKIDRSEPLGKKFYSLLVGLASAQIVNQKIMPINQVLIIDKDFVRDVLIESDVRAKCLLRDKKLQNPLAFVERFVDCIAKKGCFNEGFVADLPKSFLTQEAFTYDFTGNYAHLLASKAINYLSVKSFYQDSFEFTKDVLGALSVLEKKGLFAEITVKNKDGQEYQCLFRDLVNTDFLGYIDQSHEFEAWERVKPIVDHLNVQFGYLKGYPPSIKRFSDVLKDSYSNISINNEILNVFIDFFERKELLKVVAKEDSLHPYISKILLEEKIKTLDSKSEPDVERINKEPSNSFKI